MSLAEFSLASLMNTSPENLEHRRFEASAIADYLVRDCDFERWPRYYKELMFVYSPINHLVRFHQMHFVLINKIPFTNYVWFMKLNLNFIYFNDIFFEELIRLHNLLLRMEMVDPHSIVSYSISADAIVDGTGEVIFEVGQNMQLPQLPLNALCNYGLVESYFRTLNVLELLGPIPFHHDNIYRLTISDDY